MPIRAKLGLAIGIPLLVLAAVAADAQQLAGGADAEYIARAMTAAPPDVARDATIVRMASVAMETLKKGNGTFTCMVTNAGPMCTSPEALRWAHAWQTHTAPPPDDLGYVYMLNGDSGMSNTDPWATKPTPGNHWVYTGPHVMVVGLPIKKMISYPRTPDPDVTKPYIMWSGTPYEHLMIPLNPSTPKLAEELLDAARVLMTEAVRLSDPSLIKTSLQMRADAETLVANLDRPK